MNSTRYTQYDMDSALEKDISELRRGANLVNEVHGTTTYLVDCATHKEICDANKVWHRADPGRFEMSGISHRGWVVL